MRNLINQRLFLLLSLLFFCSFSNLLIANKPLLPKDSITSGDYIASLISYSKNYPFIQYGLNYIQWNNNEAIDPFFNKLKHVSERKVRILHIGDSHLQADYYTGYVRDELQRIFGEGGRGFVFPFTAAATHSAYDYRSYYSGKWEWARNTQLVPTLDLGVTGATIRTNDTTATFSIIFRKGTIKDNFTKLKILCNTSGNSYDLKLLASSNPDTIIISPSSIKDKQYFTIDLKKSSDTLEFFINKTNPFQSFFELYGLLIETPQDNGVLYTSMGINGAGYKSILREKYFEKQIDEYAPDLVIIDLGANDFYGYAINEQELTFNLTIIINKIRNAAPEASIIVFNSQDIFKRRRNIVECAQFSQITKSIAFKTNCAFWDWYQISGGHLSMLQWSKYQLAQRDRVHLSGNGYFAKGELLINALLNSYSYRLKNERAQNYIVSHVDTTLLKFTDSKAKPIYLAPDNSAKIDIKNSAKYSYTIQAGDNLGYIAEQFGVSINDLQEWNNLPDYRIVAGESLIIYRKGNTSVSNNKSTTSKPNNTGNISTYIIQRGDNLGSIALKNNVSVDDLKKWNNLSSTKIIAGQRLIVIDPNTMLKPIVKPSVNTQKNQLNSTPKPLGKINHTVVQGDTLWDIAKKYNTTVDQIKKNNNLVSDKLKLGMVLIISK